MWEGPYCPVVAVESVVVLSKKSIEHWAEKSLKKIRNYFGGV